MKITIDEKICLKHNLTLQEVLMALAIRLGKAEEVINNLQTKNIIIEEQYQYSVTQPWSDILDEILCDSSGDINNEERLLNLAKKMRECFPEGKMPGTAYYYRCNNREVSLKLKKFFMQYGNYPDTDIIDATKRFVASFQGDYRYMPLIKYFITKNKPIMDENGEKHIQEVSELASYLENKGEEVVNDNIDWLVNSRN